MSSTNKTTNYDLSQYVGSDKPSYLGDYNSDMYKIDAQMKTNADNISTTNTLATTAKNTADGAETHAQTGISNAATADEKAVAAQGTATSALNKATKNEQDIAKFNLTSFSNPTLTAPQDFSVIQYQSDPLTLATNSDGSIFKLYGTFQVFTQLLQYASDTITLTTNDTGLRPSASYNIKNAGIRCYATNVRTYVNPVQLTVNTNGTIEIDINKDWLTASDHTIEVSLLPMLFFNKDFRRLIKKTICTCP